MSLASATEGWEKQIEKAYGALVNEVGRAKADRFFPRVRGKKNEASQGGDEEK